MRSRAAFTLIELLVVITIIAILLAMLVPSLEEAIGLAESARCAATVRAQSLAMSHYSLDHQRRVILVQSGRGFNWWHRLAPYAGFPNFAKQPLVSTGNYHDDRSPPFMDCPTTVEKIDLTSGYYGNRDDAWGTDYTMGSYGLNLWIADYPGYNEEFPNRFGKYINAPGETPLVGDSNWIGGWPDENDTPTTSYATGDTNHAKGFQMNRWVINRHGFAVNMSFVDGSARNVRLGDLWGLRWYAGYQGSSMDLQEP